MKDKKTQVQVLILAVLVLGGVGYYLLQMSPASQPAPPPAQEESAKPAGQKTAHPRKEPNDPMGWVEDTRVKGIVAEVHGGRDPFENLLIAPPPIAPPNPGPPIPPSGDKKIFVLPAGAGNAENEHTYSKTLEWVTPDVVRKKLEDLGSVTMTRSSIARRTLITLSGYDPDFTEAVQRVKALDVEPPTPKFEMSGIVVTPEERYVTLRVDGKYYMLSEHETIPGLGWTVVKITSTDVILAKGKQIVPLRLSGGNPS